MVWKQWNIVPAEGDIVRRSFKSAGVLQAPSAQGAVLANCKALKQLDQYWNTDEPQAVKVHVTPAVREELVLTSSWETVTSLALSSTGGIIEGCSLLVQAWRSVWKSLDCSESCFEAEKARAGAPEPH